MTDRHQQNTASRVICPYCGHAQASGTECESCRGLFEPLSRQATQNAMGPWQLRDPEHPFKPPFSYRTLRNLVRRGRITADSVLRGPTTNQFWRAAGQTPGVAHLLGRCHNCGGGAQATDFMCSTCGVSFAMEDDRQFLGLSPIRPLEGAEADLPGSPQPAASPAQAAPVFPFGDAPPAARASDIPPPRSKRAGSRLGMVIATVVVFLMAVASMTALLVMRPWETAARSSAAAAEVEDAAGGVEREGAGQEGMEAAAVEDVAEPSEWQIRFEEAIATGDEDTIEAVEAAIEALRQLEHDAPAAGLPETFEAELDRLQDRLDLLRVRRFL